MAADLLPHLLLASLWLARYDRARFQLLYAFLEHSFLLPAAVAPPPHTGVIQSAIAWLTSV